MKPGNGRGPCLEGLSLPDFPSGDWPVVVEPFPDAPSPAEAYARLCRQTAPFWLDSALDVSGQGRYSFVGCDPVLSVSCVDNSLRLTRPGSTVLWQGNPFRALSDLYRACACTLPRMPRPSSAEPSASGAMTCAVT
jgi:hypothetical protein